MGMTCEKCRKDIPASAGKYVVFNNTIMFACRACAKQLAEETRWTRVVCRLLDAKRTKAEQVTGDMRAFDRFLESIEATTRKIPSTAGGLLADIPLLVSFARSYVYGENREISYNSVVAAAAALLYVVSPVDLLPDILPKHGFSDDAVVAAYCVRMIRKDLEKYQRWRDQKGARTTEVEAGALSEPHEAGSTE